MEIRDVLHGSIQLEKWERPVVDSRYFQRLRHIKQLGFAEYSFPSATHNRYIHSLGAMWTASQAFQNIFNHQARFKRLAGDRSARWPAEPWLNLSAISPEAYERFHAVVRLAALLHDIGHGPLSHTTEFAMPNVGDLRIPGLPSSQASGAQATHEHYTLKILLDSELSKTLDQAGSSFSFKASHIAALIDPQYPVEDSFFVETIDGEAIDFRPILQQLISSELDADRMDYLRRDSLGTGVSYGHFDFNWLVTNLTAHIASGKCHLALQHRALYSFEDFLISRYHMFLMVYFHYKSVIFDEMLRQYLTDPSCEYKLPADIERYCESTDAQLHSHLAASANPWARRISEKSPYRILVELHSGIPTGKKAAEEQDKLYDRILRDLDSRGTHYLLGTSTSELSKYFRKATNVGHTSPIFVRYDNHYSAPSFIPLEKCTDLFLRYGEKRSIRRVYVSPEDFRFCRDQERDIPLRYEEDSFLS